MSLYCLFLWLLRSAVLLYSSHLLRCYIHTAFSYHIAIVLYYTAFVSQCGVWSPFPGSLCVSPLQHSVYYLPNVRIHCPIYMYRAHLYAIIYIAFCRQC